MTSFTNYAENVALLHLTGQQSDTTSRTLYLALCDSSPGETATGAACNELGTGTGYARVSLSSTLFTAAVNRLTSNSASVTFAEISASAGTARYYTIVNSATHGTGEALAYGQFEVEKQLTAGSTPAIAAGEIQISITTGEISNYAANKLLDRLFRNQEFSISANALGLATSLISDSNTGSDIVECSNSGDYARVTIASSAWTTIGTASSAANGSEWSFNSATSSWGTIVSAFIADNSSYLSGNILLYDNGIASQAVDTGDRVFYSTGNFVVTID